MDDSQRQQTSKQLTKKIETEDLKHSNLENRA